LDLTRKLRLDGGSCLSRPDQPELLGLAFAASMFASLYTRIEHLGFLLTNPIWLAAFLMLWLGAVFSRVTQNRDGLRA